MHSLIKRLFSLLGNLRKLAACWLLWIPSGWRESDGAFVRLDGLRVRSAKRGQWFVEVPDVGVIPGEDGFPTEPFGSWRKAVRFADRSFPLDKMA